MAVIPNVGLIQKRLPQGSRPIASVDLTQVARADQEVARSTRNLGSAIAGAGSEIYAAGKREETRRGEFERIQAESEWLKAISEERRKSEKDPEFEGMGDRFHESVITRLEDVSGGISDEHSRAIFEARSAVDLDRAREAVDDLSFKRESDFQNTKLNEDISDHIESAHMSIDPEERDRYLLAVMDRIDTHADQGYFGENGKQKAAKLRESVTSKFAIQSIEMAEPEDRLKLLKGKLREFITKPQAETLKDNALKELEKNKEDKKLLEGMSLAKGWIEAGVRMDAMPGEADKIKDADTRRIARDEYSKRVAYAEKAGRDFQEKTYQEYASKIDNGEIRYDKIPVKALDDLTAAHRDALKKRDFNLRADKVPAKSDRVVYDTLVGLQQEGDWGKARNYFVENAHLLSESDYKSFSKSTQERKTPAELKPLYTNQQRLTIKMKDAKISKNKIDEVKNLMGEWYQGYMEIHKKVPTQKEFDIQADTFLMDQPEAWHEGWFSDTKGFEVDFALEEAVLKTVDESTLNGLNDRFKQTAGRDPNPSELLDYYKWAKGQGLAK